MAEENDDKASLEDMEVESGDIMTNIESMTKEDGDSSIDQGKMESGFIDEEETDKLADGTSDASIKEEDENSRGNITEVVLSKKSLTEDTDFSVGQLRKKSDLVIVGPNHKFNVRSRYRSASIGSCHDMCKYGHRHESEKKTSRLVHRTNREAQPLKKTTSEDLENCALEKVAKVKERKRRTSLSGPIPEKAVLMRMEDNNSPKKDIDKSVMKRVQSEIKPSTVPSPGTSSRSKTNTQAVKKPVTQSPNLQKSLTQKVKEIKTLKEEGSYSKGEKEVKTKEPLCSPLETSLKKKTGYSKGEKEIKAKEPISNSPKTPLKKSPSLKARLYKNRKSSSRFKNQVNPEEAKIDAHDDISENTVCMIRPNSDISSGENSRCTPRTSKTQGSKGSKKGTGFSLLSSSSRDSSRHQGGDQQGSETTKNKLIVIKTEDGGSKSVTPRAKSTVSRRTKILDFKNTKQTDTLREDGWSKTSTSRVKSTVEPKVKPRRKAKSSLEEKDASAWKVKFKRGTVVALQTANSAPRKLRFKRGKILGEDQNAKSEIKKLKNENDMSSETQDAEPGPEKVRLRHQEASEKKDDVDLNNVIEETASKLVKTRKSKVKALVGAFETVMSLRDRKRLVEPSAS
ncbi:uncharacterized protein LOC110700656 [Chenopodium quinoa]|uniref:Calmodulin-binding domain-containing protein n=1 Tax=Chenopodium quinoa TaxID=63459 RepID=A0A803L9E6_CHEQI|nr:uncharacterized protein LOC110700656 [Chenopodium quinoa]XP_021733921.1 uncharacterized protein LOC110700656 [Chenopodium quinoa]